MSEAELARLLTAVAAGVPGLRSLEQDPGGDRWAAAFDDGTAVVLERVAARGVLGLSADLGFPPVEHIDTVQETLLVYNSLRHRNGGASMALAEPAGELVHLVDLDLRDLTAETLAEALGDFAAQSAAWRRVVAQGARIDAALAGAAAKALAALDAAPLELLSSRSRGAQISVRRPLFESADGPPEE